MTTRTLPDTLPRTARDVVASDLDAMTARLDAELRRLAGRRLLITGGAGFLGYYLTRVPLHWNAGVPAADRIRVVVADNFRRGLPAWLHDLGRDPALTLVEHDITRPLPPELHDFDAVIHAASIASPTFYRRFPIETIDANVGGLRRLLDHCRDRADAGRPVEAILFFSTSEVYGDPDPANIPTPETYRGNVSCTGPRACYDESKRFGETLCVSFARVHGLPVTIARPFNNYGPGLSLADGRVLPDFARDVLAGNDIVMLSDGSPSRTFCYVADAVVGYYKVLLRGRPGEAYNIGTEAPEVTIAELAERVVATARELFGYRGRVRRATSDDPDYLVDNPNRRCPVIAKARTELGYDPVVSLDEGLARSLVWYAGGGEAGA
jgi:nucleoside-diphosphate-sugar epimerase